MDHSLIITSLKTVSHIISRIKPSLTMFSRHFEHKCKLNLRALMKGKIISKFWTVPII